METILLFSLRGLWGDLESHSFGTEVSALDDGVDCCGGTVVDKDSSLLVVECPHASTNFVRAALTMPTPPPYVDESTAVYRFDVVEIGTSGK